jgi:hypothetical protein
MNNTEYDRLSNIYNKYGSLSQYNYEVLGRDVKMENGNIELILPITSNVKKFKFFEQE